MASKNVTLKEKQLNKTIGITKKHYNSLKLRTNNFSTPRHTVCKGVAESILRYFTF